MTELIKRPSNDYPFDDRETLEDNYDEYLRGELAYANLDWDDLDADQVSEHDALLEATPDVLSELDADAVDDDFLRWAMARAWRRHNNLHNALQLCAQILATPPDDRSALLSYPDLRLEYARLLAEAERYDDAHGALEVYRDDDGAQPLEHIRTRGLVLILQGRQDDGIELFMEAVTTHAEEEPELSLHFTDDLLQAHLTEAIDSFLDKAIAHLTERGDDPEQLTELRLLRQGL